MATTEHHIFEELAPTSGGLYNVGVDVTFHHDERGMETYRDWRWTGFIQRCNEHGEWVEGRAKPWPMPAGLARSIHIEVDNLPGPYDHARADDSKADACEEE